MFHQGDLQSGISLAVQTQKAVFCFIYDDTETSSAWEQVISDDDINLDLRSQTVALKLRGGSQEAGYLGGICPINSVPAIVIIKNAALQANFQSNEVQVQQLKDRLVTLFRPGNSSQEQASTEAPADASAQNDHEFIAPSQIDSSGPTESHLGYLDLQPSSGQFRLPDNAYDALRAHTQSLLDKNDSPEQVLRSQLTLLEKLPIFRDEVKAIRSRVSPSPPVLSDAARDRLLRLPAVAIKAQSSSSTSGNTASNSTEGLSVYATPPPGAATPEPNARPRGPAPPPIQNHEREHTEPPPPYTSTQHHVQRDDYVRMQKQREQSQREERERIKAQIKADREERRRKEGVWKQNEAASESGSGSTGPSKPKSNEIRLQVRTFDGSTLRNTFSPSATIASDVRPWIDSSTESTAPYNLKIILTPLPNRNIEAGEEEQALLYIGIVGSGTLVMVPVKGYVESYTGNTSAGLIGSAASGGYNLVTGTVGAVFGAVQGAVKGIYTGLVASPQQQHQQGAPEQQTTQGDSSQPASQGSMRVRTLADQRLEERGRNQQFYNGNTLNFEPNKDDEDARKKD